MAHILLDLNKPINLIKLYFICELFRSLIYRNIYVINVKKLFSKVNSRRSVNIFNKIRVYII